LDAVVRDDERPPYPSLAALFAYWQEFFLVQRQPDELAERILAAVAAETRASRASLMLLDDDGNLRITAARGLSSAIIAATRLRPGEGIAGRVLQDRQPLMLPDGPDVPKAVRDLLASERIVSALSVPLVVDDAVLGVMNLAREHELPFALRDLWFAALIADGVAKSLQIARLYSQIEARERFVTRTLESIPSSLIVIDRLLRVVSVNRNFLEKTRRDLRAVIGRRVDQIFPPALLEATALTEKIDEVFRNGQNLDGGKVTYRAPGVATRIYYYRLFPVKAGQSVENVMLLMDDITDRERLRQEVQRAERHLAGVVEHASDLVVSADTQGRVLTWNRAAERLSGLTAEQARGRSLPILAPPEQRQRLDDMLARAASGGDAPRMEVPLRDSRTGRDVPIAWSCAPMQDDQGAVVGIVAVGRDLTEQRRLETQLVQSAKVASLGVMAGGIAHELRNPLGIISASAQLLQLRPDDPEFTRACADKICAATDRAVRIIESLMQFARPEGVDMRPVDVNTVVEATLTLLNHELLQRRIKLRRQIHPAELIVNGRPELLQQVFVNLMLNACNAMTRQGMITVTTRSASPYVEVLVADTGRGIPPDYLETIFDPFFTTMPPGKGTGLGLSVSYRIVTQHGGTLDVESEVGHGTIFTVRLPAPSL
jgi:PAS domain S-box-containing protein